MARWLPQILVSAVALASGNPVWLAVLVGLFILDPLEARR
jgi:hypothetical protein